METEKATRSVICPNGRPVAFPLTGLLSAKTLIIPARLGLVVFFLGSNPLVAPAAEWYVDGSVAKSGDGTSWEQAYKTIQRGIDAACDGDAVIVAKGTYTQNIQFKGKNITLASTDPLDRDVVAETIIDGNGAGSVVTFAGSETEKCVLSGFTVRNGSAGTGAGICGGTADKHTHATIRNNVIAGNTASYEGGGIAWCDGSVQNNLISGNSAHNGAGAHDCDGLIEDNTITGNAAEYEGGGLNNCGGAIQNNIITNNSAHGGGGLHACDGTVQNNTITGNSASYEGGGLNDCDGTIQSNVIAANLAHGGAGLHGCDGTIKNNAVTGNVASYIGGGLNSCAGTILNNTIAANLAQQGGGGLHDCRGTITNCIIWGNLASQEAQLSECSVPTYSCIEEWQGGGTGNISQDPRFVDPNEGDYHLWSWSPCIDAGNPKSPFSEEPEPNGGRIDMGAYGNTPEATSASKDTDGDLLPDDWEMLFFGNLSQGPTDDPDSDGRSNFLEYLDGTSPVWSGRWYVNGAVPVSGDGKSWETAFKTIQKGIDASADGDTVVVARGTYFENIRFKGENIILTSTNPFDSRVVANTIIDGKGLASVITFAGTENETCILSGFTIRNGRAYDAGGICGNRTHATIQSNVITGNSAESCGGGVAYCDGLIRNNIVTGNWSMRYGGGGGLYSCNGTIENNTIADNMTRGEGGGLYACAGTIRNCIIWGNRARGQPQLSGAAELTYSCVQDLRGGGTGNTSACPYFVDARAGDYHLRSWSPCVDAGDPSSDFSNEPQPNGGRVDMGAYGNTPEATSASSDSDSDFLPDDWEMDCFGDLSQGASGDPDGDGMSNLDEYRAGTDPLGVNYGIWYVDGSVSVSLDGTSWATAFKTIQEGIDASSHGDTVIVAEGIYVENVHLKGKNITLTGTDPLNGAAVANTVIDGDQSGSVVTFWGTEGASCVLCGFTIRNGKGEFGGGICGGDYPYDVHTLATIRNNVIVANSSFRTVDSGVYGGGLYGCDGLIENNVIAGNFTENVGGGLCECDGTIQNNVITGNSATFGGGLGFCDGAMQNNLIAGNSVMWRSGHGGGLYRCNGIVRNNTIVYNMANWGGGLDFSEGTILNCVIWGNTAREGPQINRSSTPTYSCIQGWTGGAGNIFADPRFPDPDGPDNNPATYEDNNYRLSPGSPCINRGRNESWMAGAVDLDGNPRIVDGTVDMGAYEYCYLGPWYVDCSVLVSGDGRSWPTAFKTVREGIDVAGDGDEIIVAKGIYRENVRFRGKDVVLHSTDPGDPTVVSTTVIDGGQKGSVVTFDGGETAECLLHGFTIQNGLADYGGGICGGTENRHTRATIRSNVVAQNRAVYDGGGVAFFDGLIENNVVSGNSAGDRGGGLHDCRGTIRNNTIAGNTAFYSGGGLYWCPGMIEGNTVSANSAGRGGGLDYCGGIIQKNAITGNSANIGGGGLAWCEGTIQGNTIRGNSAFYGGGLAWGEGTIQNNLIVGNRGVDRGGGLEACEGTIRNNTIVGNSAPDRGGGLADCGAAIINCIIWGNAAAHWGQLSECNRPTYSCIEEWTEGEGNFSRNPGFVDADGPDDDPDTHEDNDYHLIERSPCIDVGKNETWMWQAVDMDGNPRIFFGALSMTVDVGAYEYSSSSLRVVRVVKTATGGVEITWKSSPGSNYTIWSCYDLVEGVWVRETKKEVPAAGEITTWIDTDTAVRTKFYKIEVN